ncbi:hypothetical protein CK203_083187 [Vitis vinifera]|uniref:Uncharacterized protein n=1 Tax=Vitis vinifera TaxID=29760 RepID=A0A438DWZ0_VITVI|nr:hypothetical protein CK203_083187 [Vitis vinifera]
MTTRRVQDPIAIHFLIDGQHGILEARDIVAAMHFPPILEDLGSFRHWSQYSEPDMVSTLSGGRVTGRTILRRELPPRMLLIDLVLHTNLFLLQHVIQRRGAILDALYRISEGFYFGPHHLVMAALTYFEEKVLEDMGYPSHSPPRASSSLSRALYHFSSTSRFSSSLSTYSTDITRAGPTYHRAFFSVPAPVTCTTDTPTPPVTPAPAYAESSVGPSITVSAIEFRALMSSFHSLSASQATLVREMQASDDIWIPYRHIRLSIQLFRLSIQLSWTSTPPCSLRSTITWAYHLLHLRSHIHD